MQLYKIGELAAKANVSTRTIDYYTNLGLIKPEERSSGNYRLYSESCLKTLKLIERLKKEKYTLQEIKGKLSEMREIPKHDVLNKMLIIQEQMKKVEEDLRELEPMLRHVRDHKELRQAVQDMAAKGVSMAQVTLAILHETMYLL